MAVILTTRQPWVRRPNTLCALNRASSLSVGLVTVYDWGPRDLLPNGARSLVGHASIRPTPEFGPALWLDGAGDYAEFTSPVDHWGGNGLTVAAWAYAVTAATAFPRLIDRTYNGQFCVYRTESSSSIGLAMHAATGVIDKTDVSGAVWPTERWVHVGVTYSGASVVGYIDGRVADTSVLFAGGLDPWSGNIRVGQRVDAGAARDFKGIIGPVMLYNRALSPAEVWALYDPRTRWELYQPLVRRVYFDVGGGGGPTYTLTCDAGSYSLTGTDATLTVGRTIDCDAGSYAVTGTDAALTVGRTIDCDAGSYAVTGTDAALTVGRTIVAEAGSYTVAGTDADLTVGRTISADAGTYTLTGTDAGLTVARVLDAASGTYTLTGTAADLDYSGAGGPTYTLAADAGTYALSGTAATLTVSRTISAEAGTYTLTGTDATLAFTRLLTAEAGTYTLTGTDAALIASRALGADAGVYALTGTAAALTYSGAAPDLAAEADTWRARARPTAWRAKARPTAWKAKP